MSTSCEARERLGNETMDRLDFKADSEGSACEDSVWVKTEVIRPGFPTFRALQETLVTLEFTQVLDNVNIYHFV